MKRLGRWGGHPQSILLLWIAVLGLPVLPASAQDRASRAAPASSSPVAAPHPFRLEAPCGNAPDFVRAVQERIPAVGLRPAARHEVVRVEIERGASAYRGELTILLQDSRKLVRRLTGETCEDTFDALAFVAALALDPESSTPLRVQQVNESPPAATDRARALSEPVLPQNAAGFGQVLGISGGGHWGLAPEPLIRVEGWWTGGTTRAGWLAPSLRAGGSYGFSGALAQVGGTAHFNSLTIELDACPSRATLGALHLRPCAALSVGANLVEGSETYAPERSTRPWLEPGVSVLSDLDLGERFVLALRAGIGFPLLRDSYQFGSQVFHEVPAFSAYATFGLGVRL